MDKLISERIRTARIERNLTQKQVANHLGYKTSNAVSEIERGKVKVSASDLYKLSYLFTKPLGYFYGDDYGGKGNEDIVEVLKLLSPQDREGVKHLAKSLSDMKSIVADIQASPELEKDRKILESLYDSIIEYMKPLSRQLALVNTLKNQIEKDLEMKPQGK